MSALHQHTQARLPSKRCISVAARLRRAERAHRLGYIQAKPPTPAEVNVSIISVPARLAVRATRLARAAEAHEALNATAGRPHHFAGEALAAARPKFDPLHYRSLRNILRAGNDARHWWGLLHLAEASGCSWTQPPQEDSAAMKVHFTWNVQAPTFVPVRGPRSQLGASFQQRTRRKFGYKHLQARQWPHR